MASIAAVPTLIIRIPFHLTLLPLEEASIFWRGHENLTSEMERSPRRWTARSHIPLTAPENRPPMRARSGPRPRDESPAALRSVAPDSTPRGKAELVRHVDRDVHKAKCPLYGR